MVTSSVHFSIDEEANCLSNYTTSGNKITFFYPCVLTTTCKPYHISFKPGVYLVELWGAQGGDGRVQNTPNLRPLSGGRGSYVSGEILISKPTHMFLYIGGKGEDQISMLKSAYGKGGFNGGGDGGADLSDSTYPESNGGGGGATDIRLIIGETVESLKSRIIISGGGGSASSSNTAQCNIDPQHAIDLICSNNDSLLHRDFHGGPGGILHGYKTSKFTYVGTQTGRSFGRGGNGISLGLYTDQAGTSITGGSTGGGGGGYYGGTSIDLSEIPTIGFLDVGGAGGSSYVSGCNGCNSVSLQPKDEIIHTGASIHYSNHVFGNIQMYSGFDTFISPQETFETGHSGNGAASITLLYSISSKSASLHLCTSFIPIICLAMCVFFTA